MSWDVDQGAASWELERRLRAGRRPAGYCIQLWRHELRPKPIFRERPEILNIFLPVDKCSRPLFRERVATDFWPATSCDALDEIMNARNRREPIFRRRDFSEQIPENQKNFLKIFFKYLT